MHVMMAVLVDRCVACGALLDAFKPHMCPRCGVRVEPRPRVLPARGYVVPYGKTLQLDLLHEREDRTPVADASLLPSAQPLLPLTVLAGRYRIQRALKSGGMGAVYLALDEHEGQMPCAIKEMLDRFTTDDEREEGQEWFRREATTLAALEHPNIPRIYDYFIERGRYYLALEFVEGDNLEDLLSRRGCPGLPEQLVLSLATQITEVLTYLHEQKPPIIFRDLKPANIMITPQGDVRIVDFGIARAFSALRGASLVGTPGYAPAEQYQGLADAMSDLYSLGATMHHLLTGCDPRTQPPFQFKPIRTYVPGVCRATERLLEGVLLKESSERGPRLEEFGRQLRRIEADLVQGLVPAVIGSIAFNAPGDQMPPTHMTVPGDTMDLGIKSKGERHPISLPVGNDGKSELRVVMRANVPWLHAPDGQVRVPPGTLVKVPLYLDATLLPPGKHTARIELTGNGGTTTVPLAVEISYWWYNGATVLMVAGVSVAMFLTIIMYALLRL
jgi:serine/threonine protein kinase